MPRRKGGRKRKSKEATSSEDQEEAVDVAVEEFIVRRKRLKKMMVEEAEQTKMTNPISQPNFRRQIGPMDTSVNLGLSKVKIEQDYDPQMKPKEEPTEETPQLEEPGGFTWDEDDIKIKIEDMPIEEEATTEAYILKEPLTQKSIEGRKTRKTKTSKEIRSRPCTAANVKSNQEWRFRLIFPCQQCKIVCKSKTAFRKHVKSTHAVPKQEWRFRLVYTCKQCTTTYTSKTANLKHMKSPHTVPKQEWRWRFYEKVYHCDHCQRVCYSPDELETHVRKSHTIVTHGEKSIRAEIIRTLLRFGKIVD